MSMLLQAYFHGEGTAYAKLESLVWPTGPVCPRCGRRDRVGSVQGRGARVALRRCCRCRQQFRATVGTIFEGSHVPLQKWLQACYLRTGCDVAVRADELHATLEVTYNTALAILRRLEYALGAAPAGTTIGPRPAEIAWRASDRSLAALPGRLPRAAAPDQSEAFIALARRLLAREDEASFDRMLARLAGAGEPRTLH